MFRLFKLTLLFSVLSFPCSAQKYYKLNVDSIAVLVAGSATADTFYVATSYYDCEPGYVFLKRGKVFWSKDVKENGFIKIYNPYDTLCWDEGWIPVGIYESVRRCGHCKGRGTLLEECEVCGGSGDWNCCHFTGHKLCSYCGGIGFY